MSFSDKQLDFVNYTSGQSLKFLDTLSVLQTLNQYSYRREFDQVISITGGTSTFVEDYEVHYAPMGNGDIDLHVSQDASSTSTVFLTFASYQTFVRADSLLPSFSALTINGKVYTNVYTLKMFKDGQYVNNNDTATLFHNRQFGAIQLLFSTGKKIVRSD